ncbi:MAG: cyclic nucleotide-binding domain-containing protein, partial [Sedimenticolaceae bacterium]
MASTHDTDALRKIAMLADLPPWQLEVVADAVEPVEVRKGAVILERGSDDGFTYFLREGEISLEASDGDDKTIEITAQSARTPVANLRPRIFGVKAMSRVRGI